MDTPVLSLCGGYFQVTVNPVEGLLGSLLGAWLLTPTAGPAGSWCSCSTVQQAEFTSSSHPCPFLPAKPLASSRYELFIDSSAGGDSQPL